jgi:hypothetical protein
MYRLLLLQRKKDPKYRWEFTTLEEAMEQLYRVDKKVYFALSASKNFTSRAEDAIYLLRLIDIGPEGATFTKKSIRGRIVRVQDDLLPLLTSYFDPDQ